MTLTDQEQVILKAIDQVKHGDVALIADVIKAVGYPKATTKKALISLLNKGAVSLHRHDYPSSLSPTDRKLMVLYKGDYFNAVSMRKRNPQSSKGKTALRRTGRALKSAARGLLASGSEILGAGASALNPVRRKIRNKYIDLVIKGQAKKTPDGWKVGKKVFAQGRGTVSVSSGYYLDRHTGMVYAKRERNVQMGFYDASGFHPIRASADYSEGQRASRSRRAKSVKRKAIASASHRRKVSSRRSTTKRLASRSIKKVVKTRRRRNVQQGFYDSSGFHPIRASSDYDPGTAGETGRKAKTARSKKRVASKRKAASTARTRARVSTRKATTKRLADRAIRKSAGLLKKRNPLSKEQERTAISSAQKQARAQKRRDQGTVSFEADWFRRWRSLQPKSDWPEIDKLHRDAYREESGFRNPSATEIRKKFAGSVGPGQDLFFPEGTPKESLAKLGKLVSITTEQGTIKPIHGTAWLCADTKEKLHIGATSNAPLFSGPARSFGKVSKVEYESSKPHLGYRGPIIWFHRLGEETGHKPTLHADGKGGLVFRGGQYRLTKRGIEN